MRSVSRMLIAVSAAFLLLTCMVGVPVGRVAAALPVTLYVSPGGNDSNSGLTPAEAKLTIQAGITAAGAGGTVLVAQGVYHESLTISQSGITLTGDPGDPGEPGEPAPGPGTTPPVLDGTGFDGLWAIKITQGISNVTIEGFEIRNYLEPHPLDNPTDSDAIVAWNSGTFNVTVRDNYMHHLGYAGVLIGNEGNSEHTGWTVTRNIINNFAAYGIDLENVRDSSITDNVISEPTWPNSFSWGIVLQAIAGVGKSATTSGITISGNTFTDYPDGAIGFVSDGSATGSLTTVENITVEGNIIGTTNWWAIGCYKFSPGSSIKDLTIDDNDITVNNPQNAGYALDLRDVAGTSTLTDNRIALTGPFGVSWFHAVRFRGPSTGAWTMSGNRLDGGDWGSLNCGLLIPNTLPASAQINVTNNTITGFANGIQAEQLLPGTTVTVSGNSIAGNSVNGILAAALGPSIAATNNWWGGVNGPTHASNKFNVGTQGNAVSDNVTFVPWLNSGVDSEPATPGFQPAAGTSFAPVTTTNPVGSYASIQAAVNASNPGGTVSLATGTFTEQVVINKDLTVQGTGASVVKAPATVSSFKIPESTSTFEPVVLLFGGSVDGSGGITGTGRVTGALSGLVVDGNNRVPTSGRRAVGIMLRNMVGQVDHNIVRNMYMDGAQTFGIMIYGDSVATIHSNTVSGWARGGIGATGDFGTNGNGPLPDPQVIISGNTVTGPGMGVPVTWAPNGIQVGYGARGTVTGNNVTGCGYPGSDWTGSGIIAACANPSDAPGSPVVFEHNIVTGNQTGIAVCGWMWQADGATSNHVLIHGNTVNGNDWGISVQDKAHGTVIEGNTVTGNTYDGVDVCNFYGYVPTGTLVNGNAIYGNNPGANADSGGLWVDTGVATVDATNNWWGHPSGANHIGDNPTGQGDVIIGLALHDPWYINEPMTILSNELHLTVSVTGLGTVTKNPDPDSNEHYSYGDVVTLTPVPDPGWQFASWSGAVVSNPLTITGNTIVGATFTQIPYTLTVNVTGSGTVAKNPDQATYVYGDVVTLTPAPTAGWQFDSWSGAVVANQVTIADVTIVGATFTQIPYTLTVNIIGSGTVAKNPDQPTYVYGGVVILAATPASGWRFDHWTGSLTGSANPASLTFDGNETVTAVFDALPPPPPPPPPPGDLGPFEEESEDGVVVIDVPEGISENPVFLTIGNAENPPPTDGNPNLGAYDVELKDAKTGEAITELTKSITLTFHYTPAMLAAAGVTDPHDLVIWYWDEDAEPEACWVALPTVVDEVNMTISTTVDHLTTFIAMVDADFPKLGDIAGHWAQTDILRLASYGAVGGYADGTFRPETAVTRAQYAKFIVATLGITKGTTLPAGFKDASDVQGWAVPYLAACLRDGIMTGANSLLRPNATITRVEAAAMVVRALGLAVGGGGTGGVLTFSDAASVPAWATAFVAEAVQHGLIAGLPGNVFNPAGTLTRAQAATVLSHAVDVK